MQAMTKLEQAGFTRADIAQATDCTRQGVGHWARNRNAPDSRQIQSLIELGATRGITFLASDFLPESKAA